MREDKCSLPRAVNDGILVHVGPVAFRLTRRLARISVSLCAAAVCGNSRPPLEHQPPRERQPMIYQRLEEKVSSGMRAALIAMSAAKDWNSWTGARIIVFKLLKRPETDAD